MKIFNGDTLIDIDLIEGKKSNRFEYAPMREKSFIQSERPEGFFYNFISTEFYTIDEFEKNEKFPHYQIIDNEVFIKPSVVMTFIGGETRTEYFDSIKISQSFVYNIRKKHMKNSFTIEDIIKEGTYENFKKDLLSEKESV